MTIMAKRATATVATTGKRAIDASGVDLLMSKGFTLQQVIDFGNGPTAELTGEGLKRVRELAKPASLIDPMLAALEAAPVVRPAVHNELVSIGNVTQETELERVKRELAETKAQLVNQTKKPTEKAMKFVLSPINDKGMAGRQGKLYKASLLWENCGIKHAYISREAFTFLLNHFADKAWVQEQLNNITLAENANATYAKQNPGVEWMFDKSDK
jgi:hypothetical protein